MNVESTHTEVSLNDPELQENNAEALVSKDAVSPSLEEKNTHLRNRLAKLEPTLAQLEKSNSNMQVALGISERRAEQLEANIKAVRMQRDLFMEREADALVDKTLLEKQIARTNQEAESQIKEIHTKYRPLSSKLNQVTNSLSEVRDKFGSVKHELKICQEEKQDLNHKYHQQLDKNDILEKALAWYIESTAGIKYSVPYRFNKVMNTPLTPQHILTAFEAKISGVPLRVTQDSFVDFIIRSVRDAANKEKGYSEI